MTRSAVLLAVLASSVVTASCNNSTEPAADVRCGQTFEFGNFGCARIVALVADAPAPVPQHKYWIVFAVPARTGTGAEVGQSSSAGPGQNRIQLTRTVLPAQGTGDTATVWVIARLYDDSPELQGARPLYAADSVQHIVRFAAVGEIPVVDTVLLHPRRP